MTLKYKRIGNGEYLSACGRIMIKREVSQQTRKPDEEVWEWTIDGKWHHFGQDTKRDAITMAERKLAEIEAKKAAAKFFTPAERFVILTILDMAKNTTNIEHLATEAMPNPVQILEDSIAKIRAMEIVVQV